MKQTDIDNSDFFDGKTLYENDPAGKAAFENFGIKYLFPWQRLVIANILEANDYLMQKQNEAESSIPEEESDSFCKGRQIVLLPTGAGKSLCFQIPALLLDGPTMVIYPLLALMTDQQRRMEEGCLRSVIFRGGQTAQERSQNFEKIKNGAKIILANPEVLKSEELLDELSKIGIKHIAIDEAHCVSEWGDSFRPAYLGLGDVIKKLNPPLITAFTATASPVVLERVAEILFNGEAHVVRSESDRKNILYFVKRAASKTKEVLLLAEQELHPMIIFCGTRNNCEDMAQELNTYFGRNIAKFYHAGLAKEEKDRIEKWFYESKDGILCATCAYGMGVDKKDIKTVIHLQAPQTAEAYIQEAGRGGRDGSIAKAILVWSLEDSIEWSKYSANSREAAMKKFAESTTCRRQILLDALGGEQAYCSGCDICNNDKVPVADWEVALNLVRKCKYFYSKDSLEKTLLNKLNNKNLGQNKRRLWNHSDAQNIINQLIGINKLYKSNKLWKGRFKEKKELET